MLSPNCSLPGLSELLAFLARPREGLASVPESKFQSLFSDHYYYYHYYYYDYYYYYFS